MRPALLSLALILAAGASPALADPNCLGGGNSGVHVSLGASVGGGYTAQEQAVFDQMEARRHGINADSAERTWLGCIKITRRDELGRWVTEYYDPDNFEQKTTGLDLRLR